ncbi:hypothetical protein MKW94_022856 [Papaver nudicaule]|uniref:Uncharacterized protein n=1 Tax=Papaver nudicaule TaxID=74823 RepID=A0AA41VG11_PAPNU|nr:hypothetical protein [Papaver nudicaule]
MKISKPFKKRKRDANTPNLQSQATCDQKKDHQINPEEEEEVPAPYVILVQGPPNVSKKRRLQFVECPNDMCGMIDAAKYADVVLLLIDASYGFEMETFEFLTLLEVHGVPKVMGVLTHLDEFKDEKEKSETKQRLKLQFWTEIYDEAELFYLSGLDRGMDKKKCKCQSWYVAWSSWFLIQSINNRYRKSQIHILARFISDMKLHPLPWRAVRPYVLVDHFEDITPPEKVYTDKKCDRNITLDGYFEVHIAGVGDFPIAGITRLPDPCPLPSAKMMGLCDNEIVFHSITPVEEVDMLHLRKGTYIRLEVRDVPFEMVEKFDPQHPILVGGISLEEENIGYMQARLKQHSWQWHTESLKTSDPITVSIGWRRYQTTPVYAMEETRQNGSHEMLHCAPEHTYCLAMFWGPLASPNTGLVIIQNVAEDKDMQAAFQITATGVVLRNNQTEKIVKEHKQKGTPFKFINGNNALIKDMFTSDCDVVAHKDRVIYTTRGVRGRVIEAAPKKLVYKLMRKGGQPGEGIARCVFYREVSESDEFFRRVYEPVQVPCCFNPFMASQFRDSLDKDATTRRRQTLGQRWVVVFSDGEPKTSVQLREEYKIKKKQKAMEKKKSQMLVLPEKKRRPKKKGHVLLRRETQRKGNSKTGKITNSKKSDSGASVF